jgi:acyl-CoA thioester hydrolase
MITYSTTYRVIYGDTDTMGVAYYANYLRWFEIGRTELFRFLGMPYHVIEERGIFLPVSEAYCKYAAPARYDDLLTIRTDLDSAVKGGMKFNYRILDQDGEKILATGHTLHAFMDKTGRVVRPPKFLRELIAQKMEESPH